MPHLARPDAMNDPMHTLMRIALLSIASCTLWTGVSAQNAYKCGNSYSQTPCPGGIAIDPSDPRSSSQKTQADLIRMREAKAADAMATARQQQAKIDQKTHSPRTVPTKTRVTQNEHEPTRNTPTKQLAKRKEPAYFTAQVPGVPKKSKPSTPQ